MQMIMTRVAAATIRATRRVLPGYGVSSFLSHAQSHAWWALEAGKDCAIDAISTPANHYDCRFAYAEQIRGGILYSHADRITSCQMHPVQRPLDIRQTLFEAANNICVRSHAKSDALHHAGKVHVRFGQDVDVGPHSGRDAM